MKFILIVLVVLGIVWPCLRYTIYGVSNAVAGTLGQTRRRLGGLFRPLLRGMVTAGLADMMVFPSYWMGVLGDRGEAGAGTPVLLVHGLFHNASAWWLMRRRLRAHGFTNIHTYQYNTFSGDFLSGVEGLRRKMDSLLHGHPEGKVLLVGHSLGGLVCRVAVGHPVYWDRIAGIVTLGTPHGGSDLARFGTNSMARGLIPGHEIPKIADKMVDAKCRKLAIYNLADDYVFPLNTLSPQRPGWEEKECSPMGHVWMLYSKEIANMVGDFLKEVA